MGTIVLDRVTAGTEITTNEFNNNATTLENVVNGEIENVNIDSAAAIEVSKLQGGTDGQYLKSSGIVPTWTTISHPKILEASGTVVNVVSSTTETAVFSETIPANTLGAHGAVRIRMHGDYLNDTGATRVFDLVVRLGATDIFDDQAPSIVASGSRRPWTLDMLISNEAVTNVQLMTGTFALGSLPATTAGFGEMGVDGILMATFAGNGAFDTTTAMLIEVRVQHLLNSASLSFRKRYGMMELIVP